MEYTEEIKKEADSVVEKHILVTQSGMSDHIFSLTPKKEAIEHAIQDRQSVLELAEIALEDANWTVVDFWSNKVQSLTQQIEYLKSKL